MRDQHWLGFWLNDMADNHLKVAVAVIANVRLERSTPTPVEELSSGCHARIRRCFRLRHDTGQRPDAGCGMHSRE
jgi:hypothetical protein